MKNLNAKGITLIALVITIIVLLILAAVSIATLTGENGILTQATEAKKQTEIAEAKEQAQLDIAAWKADKLEKNENSSITDTIIKDILTGKKYVGTAGDTSFTTKNGYEISYSELYNTSTGEGSGEDREPPKTEDTSGANMPELKDGMQGITFADDGTETVVTNTSKKDWYSYEITTDEDMTDGGTTEGGNSKWANAKLNGNYYVWIPRYAYKIDNSENYTSQSGTSHKIDVEFIGTNVTSSNVATEVGEGYIVHPAFTFGTEELSGFWVGKYETSGSETTPTILPNKTSLRDINVSTMFSTAQKLSTTNYDAHMMKNIEWGAVAYLAQSPYGRNGTEVSVNQCKNYYTGTGAGTGENKIYNSSYTWDDITDDQKYNGSIGKLASTTGNIYGVYDMSGGANECVMGFYGTEEDSTVGDTGFSTFPDRKYYDLYTAMSEDATNIGDALYETKHCNNDGTSFVYNECPVFKRGGIYDGSAGLFAFLCYRGDSSSEDSFRVCLAVK